MRRLITRALVIGPIKLREIRSGLENELRSKTQAREVIIGAIVIAAAYRINRSMPVRSSNIVVGLKTWVN